jgi:hypothetical protein
MGPGADVTIIRSSPSLFEFPATWISGLIQVGNNAVCEYQGDLKQPSTSSSVLITLSTSATFRHRGTLYGPNVSSVGIPIVSASGTSGFSMILDKVAPNASSGVMPGLGVGWRLRSDSQMLAVPTASGTVTMVPSDSVGDPPAQTDVRDGVSYHFDTLEGSLVVPIPAHVSIGVATDNTVGTLVAGMTALELRQALFHADDTANKLRVSSAGAVALDSASIDAIWDEALTGATHNIASSAGRRLRQLADTVVLVDGVCDAASNAGTDSTGTITLEVGTTTACVGQAIRCENQVRFIASYNAGTRVAQLDRPWCVVPDAGDEYVILNVRNPLVGLASLALAGSTAAVVNDINTVTDKIDTGLVLDGVVYQFTANMLELGPSGGGGDATLAKQEEILAALQGVEAIQVASPNVLGNLVLTQGDDYDGTANPRASWTVTTDYTTGWTVRLTIRDSDDAVVYTNTGSVVSATVVAVTIAAPTGLTMSGCPGLWQGKFDVELTHSSGKKKTIAIGTCYINEDQTR